MTTDEAYLRFRHEFIALDPERYPAEFIDAQVWAGFWRCWGNEHAAILAEVKAYPSGVREVHGIAAAGELEAIIELIPLAEQFGRETGCARAVIDSLPAWSRIMKDKGYCVNRVEIVKGLA